MELDVENREKVVEENILGEIGKRWYNLRGAMGRDWMNEVDCSEVHQ